MIMLIIVWFIVVVELFRRSCFHEGNTGLMKQVCHGSKRPKQPPIRCPSIHCLPRLSCWWDCWSGSGWRRMLTGEWTWQQDRAWAWLPAIASSSAVQKSLVTSVDPFPGRTWHWITKQQDANGGNIGKIYPDSKYMDILSLHPSQRTPQFGAFRRPNRLCQATVDTGVPGSHPNIVLGMLGRMELRTPSIPKSHPKSFGQCKRNTNVDRMNS